MFCQLYVIGVFVSQGFLEVLIRTRHPIIRIVDLLRCEEVVFTSVIQIREVCDNPLNSYILKTHKINLIPKFSLSRNLRNHENILSFISQLSLKFNLGEKSHKVLRV